MDLKELAEYNLRTHLKDNPCRGIVLGLDARANQVQFSWIMGRSENSQNRVYVEADDNGSSLMKTEPFDPSKVKDPRLIIYNAMRNVWIEEARKRHIAYIVSNGDQTDTVHSALAQDLTYFDRDATDLRDEASFQTFFRALRARNCEPDPANFTPRITGMQDTRYPGFVFLSLLKADAFAKQHWIDAQRSCGLKREDFPSQDAYFDVIDERAGLDRNKFPTIRDEFTRTIMPGFGYMITTYMSGSQALPSFTGEPLLVSISGSLEETMQTFWNALEPEWRVSLSGREGIHFAEPINKHKRAA